MERRVALVTGAASGIGLGVSRTLLAAGAHVVVTDRDGDAVTTAASELAVQFPGRVAHTTCDVTSFKDARKAASVAADRFGGLDIVISNAGTAPSGPLHTAAGDGASARLARGQFARPPERGPRRERDHDRPGHGRRAPLQRLEERLQPRAGLRPVRRGQGCPHRLDAPVRHRPRPRGIRANAVNADRIRTELFGGGLAEARAKARGVPVDEYFRTNLLHRETTVEDVARAFLYLATAEATTGGVLTVDGGNVAAFPR